MEPQTTIKLFVGGVSHETNEQTLRDYFSKYGEIRSSEILRDRTTGVPRGFGFIVFVDSSVVERVLSDTHVILGKKVEVKVARPKGSKEPLSEAESSNHCKPMKIFVGGIPPNLTTEELKKHFDKYGTVEHAEIRHPRGFGFVTFESEEALKNALKMPFQYLKDKRVEVKVAEEKVSIRNSVTCGNCLGSKTSPIFPAITPSLFPVYVPYLSDSFPPLFGGVHLVNNGPYHMSNWYSYGTTLNEWYGGSNYNSYFSGYDHGGERQDRNMPPVVIRPSPPVVIRPPPPRAEQNGGNAVDLADENQLMMIAVQEDTNAVDLAEENLQEDGNGGVQTKDGIDGEMPREECSCDRDEGTGGRATLDDVKLPVLLRDHNEC